MKSLGEVEDQMRVGTCPGCGGILSFELKRVVRPEGAGTSIAAGHSEPSCDWYKAYPDSMSVARAVGLVKDNN